MNAVSDRQVIAAFFRNDSQAENAIADLHRAGFRSDQIGCSCDDVAESGAQLSTEGTPQHRSFWQKVEGFFTGEEGYEDRDTGAGDGRYNEGVAVGPTLSIPNRYNERLSAGGSIVTVHDSARIAEAEQILTRNGGEIDREFYGSMTGRSASEAGAERVAGERRIQLLSERLRVNKERVQQGEVRLRKEVRTEQQHIEVPVTREELVIERVPVNESQAASSDIGDNGEVRVPLTEERVTVNKTPVVREEVRIGKRAVQETKTVADEVRHEELKVDDDRNLVNRDRLENEDVTDRIESERADLDRKTGRRKIA